MPVLMYMYRRILMVIRSKILMRLTYQILIFKYFLPVTILYSIVLLLIVKEWSTNLLLELAVMNSWL